MKRTAPIRLFLLLCILVTALVLPGQAASAAFDPAKLTTDLNALVIQGNTLVSQMSQITLTSTNMSTALATFETSVVSYLNAVGTVFKTVQDAVGTTTFSVTSDMLNALQNLATIQATLGSGLLDLSRVIATLSSSTTLTTLQSSLTAMLRLSDDIGVMADRILEMADKILIMANNIGLMADRIIATQVIQSDNLKVVTDAILQTQLNTILLIALIS
jgi:hypothetical protein